MSFTAISSYKGVWNGNYCRPSVSLVEEGKGEGDFGSQCAVSTTKPSSPWNPEGRKGMERCCCGVAQEGSQTVTKQQGSEFSVAWTKTSWLSPTKRPSPKTWLLLAISPHQPLPKG